MSDPTNLSLPEGFNNIVRLFPLPNVVLFPGVVQALHLFEPRYRDMMADALQSDELIAMAYLQQQDHEVQLGAPPTISPTVCIGKILSHTLLDDGRYNLFLIGAKRAKVIHEFPMEVLYRTAEIEIVEDYEGGPSNNHYLRNEIVEAFRKLVTQSSGWDTETLDQFLSQDLPFGQLVDMICYSSGASPADQQRVLEAVELSRRGEIVLQLIQDQIDSNAQRGGTSDADSGQSFPPDFSVN